MGPLGKVRQNTPAIAALCLGLVMLGCDHLGTLQKGGQDSSRTENPMSFGSFIPEQQASALNRELDETLKKYDLEGNSAGVLRSLPPVSETDGGAAGPGFRSGPIQAVGARTPPAEPG